MLSLSFTENHTIMALPIKQVPILSGKAAEEFERRADEALKRPRREISPERRAELLEVERLMREYVPSWERNDAPGMDTNSAR
jgi:hypothetical protein